MSAPLLDESVNYCQAQSLRVERGSRQVIPTLLSEQQLS
jgi:hypothetical protein